MEQDKQPAPLFYVRLQKRNKLRERGRAEALQ